MRPSLMNKDYKTTYMYRDHRARYRFQRKNENGEHAKNVGGFPAAKTEDYSQTLEYKEQDQWMFSDNKIKNSKLLESSQFHVKNRLPKDPREAEWKKHLIANIKDGVKNDDQSDDELAWQIPEHVRKNRLLSANPSKEGHHSNRERTIDSGQSVQYRRQATSVFGARKAQKNINMSMEIGGRKTNQFSPTIVGVKLNSFTEAEKKVKDYNKSRMVNSRKSSVSKPKKKVIKIVTGPKVNSYAKQIVHLQKPDRTRYNIDGWEIDNPSFCEFDQLRYSPRPNASNNGQVVEKTVEELDRDNKNSLF